MLNLTQSDIHWAARTERRLALTKRFQNASSIQIYVVVWPCWSLQPTSYLHLSLSLFRLQIPLPNIYHPFLLLPSLMFFPSYYIPKLQMPASNSSCVRFVNFPRQSGRLPPNLSWRSRTGPKGDATFWLHVLKITIPIVKGEPNRSKELSKTTFPPLMEFRIKSNHIKPGKRLNLLQGSNQ